MGPSLFADHESTLFGYLLRSTLLLSFAAREASLEELLLTLCRAKELEGSMVVRREDKKVRQNDS